jgi:predicted mannosyl-3-phosphoglycerate phosphatase (HAD superfamily)
MNLLGRVCDKEGNLQTLICFVTLSNTKITSINSWTGLKRSKITTNRLRVEALGKGQGQAIISLHFQTLMKKNMSR